MPAASIRALRSRMRPVVHLQVGLKVKLNPPTHCAEADRLDSWQIRPMPRRRARKRGRLDSRLELGRLFEETVGLYWRLTRAAAAIYGRGPLSGPRRTVLMAFARGGPQTVARLAAVRAQSRQRLQPLVNSLVAEGLLERQPNPLHRRSALIGLTTRGIGAVRQIQATEGRLRAVLPLTVSRRALVSASTVLRTVNALFDQPGTLQMLRKGGRSKLNDESR